MSLRLKFGFSSCLSEIDAAAQRVVKGSRGRRSDISTEPLRAVERPRAGVLPRASLMNDVSLPRVNASTMKELAVSRTSWKLHDCARQRQKGWCLGGCACCRINPSTLGETKRWPGDRTHHQPRGRPGIPFRIAVSKTLLQLDGAQDISGVAPNDVAAPGGCRGEGCECESGCREEGRKYVKRKGEWKL